MSLTYAGRNEIAKCITGTGNVFNEVNTHLCVGDSTAVFDASQVDLQGTTNVFRKKVDAGYPVIVDNKVTYKTTFSGTEANYPWNEWGVANAFSGGTMITRKVEYNGTKVAGQTWVFQVTLTIEIGA